MHDRRIDGEVHIFGDQGLRYVDDVFDSLVMWDHKTESMCDQWTGITFVGPYEGVRLTTILAETKTWSDWLALYPDTLALSPAES